MSQCSGFLEGKQLVQGGMSPFRGFAALPQGPEAPRDVLERSPRSRADEVPFIFEPFMASFSWCWAASSGHSGGARLLARCLRLHSLIPSLQHTMTVLVLRRRKLRHRATEQLARVRRLLSGRAGIPTQAVWLHCIESAVSHYSARSVFSRSFRRRQARPVTSWSTACRL